MEENRKRNVLEQHTVMTRRSVFGEKKTKELSDHITISFANIKHSYRDTEADP